MKMKLYIAAFCMLFVQFVYAGNNQGAVAMPDSFSADAAAKILKQGGNAIDAAITAQFVLAVTLPEAGNLGGGGFMLVHKDGKNDFIDYREKAPLTAHRDMYLDEQGNVIAGKSLYGIFSSGVPGTVSGMWLVHQKYGSLPWKTLVQPAVNLANEGFVVPEKLGHFVNYYLKKIKRKNLHVNFADHFSQAQTNTLFKQPELAQTLIRIRDQGEKGFYQGKTATLISDFMKKHGGLISTKDLAAYQAKSRTPVMADWNGYQVVTSPPPSSGGIAIIQWLKMYEMKKPDQHLEHNSAPYIHLLAEIGKRVFADRANFLGDPDFVNVPQAELISDQYLKQRAKGISLTKISTTEKIKPGIVESEQTTHFSVMDKWGNAVSNTTTLNLGFGSGMVVTGAGFILNNEMDDFSAKPGVANVFGALGGKANEIQPQKRMLSSMTPTIVLKDNKVFMVTGSPGGTTIISSVYESILNVTEFNMTAVQAVNATRFHHQLWPKNVIRHHNGLRTEVKKQLTAMGYVLDNRRFGDMHVIVNRNGKLEAGSEASGRGKAIVLRAAKPNLFK
ncbi:MAG: gamma-glutamyltransferase [Gammaproteobacteria bacterium]|nr:MAG: gamma-glutamyltransferase [Gammaproteobacteria bacterium]